MYDIDFAEVQALYGHQNAMSLKDEVASRVSFGDSGKKLKPLKEFLKSNQCVYKMKTAILYHGTAAKHEICEQGIRKTTSKTKGSLQSSEGYVYLSLYPNMAKQFAQMHYPGMDVKVYAVEVLVRDLLADHDQLFNKRLWAEGSGIEIGKSLADSLVHGSGARVGRHIAAYQVRDITHLLPC